MLEVIEAQALRPSSIYDTNGLAPRAVHSAVLLRSGQAEANRIRRWHLPFAPN